MDRWPLRRRLWLLVTLLCSVSVVISVVSLLAFRNQEREVTELTKVTGPAIAVNSAILQTMTNAETALLGYGATGDPELLTPFYYAQQQVTLQQSQLDALLRNVGPTVADPRLVTRQDAAQDAAIARWWLYANRVKAEGLRESKGLDAEKALFGQIRSANAALASTLQADQRVLRSRASRRVTITVAVLLAAIALTLLTGFGAAGRLSRTVTGPIGRLRQVVLRQRTGDDGVRADEDHGPAEIRDLAAAFNELTARYNQLVSAQTEALRLQQEAFAAGPAIRFTSGIQEAMQVTCDHTGSALRACRVTAAAIDESPKIFAAAQWHHDDLADLSETQTEWASRLWHVPERRASGQLIVSDLQAEDIQGEGWPGLVHRATGATALMMVPAGLGDRVVGGVCVLMDTGPRAWTDAEVAFLQQVANFLARAIVQAEHDAQNAGYTARLESLDRQKTEFLSTVSHELRTPLTSIQGYLELLCDGDAGPVSDEQQRMLAIIERNATRLRGLIEDILVLNRIETGGFVAGTREVSLRGLAVQTAEELQPLADKANVRLRVHLGEDPGPVTGDRAQLQRALVNIVSNAIKFTPSGGTVTLTCRIDPAGEVIITCQDTGIGIPKADLEHLFTRFFRASNATSMAIPGTGLGLAIVAAIVDVHHGRLAVDSAEGEGTTITLHFPLATADVGA